MSSLWKKRGCGFFLLLLSPVDAALPPGYDSELYCPAEHCLRRRTDRESGFAGPRSAFHECAKVSEGGAVEAAPSGIVPEAWGEKLGEKAKQGLLEKGFHQRLCSEVDDAAAAKTAAAKSGTCTRTRNSSEAAVHAAFYLWYGTPEVDGKWMHWNHKVLPHWERHIDERHKKFDWEPPHEPHSPFMPSAGCYSSRDNATLKRQFSEMKRAGVDSAILSWWGRKDLKGKRDDADSGANTDELVPAVLEAAWKNDMHISFHIEPYEKRSPKSFLEDLKYIKEKYGSHPAIWREGPKNLPLFWLYDISHMHSKDQVDEWREALDSVRGTELDGVFMSLFTSGEDVDFVERAGFDGGYTYFASNFFATASNPQTWTDFVRKMRERGKFFVPAVGPGYDDQKIRPWNEANWRDREGGQTYDRMWEKALEAQPHAIGVTSYNEWGEGTQIEPAKPWPDPGKVHLDYLPHREEYYLDRTKWWSDKFKAAQGVSTCT